MKVKEMISNLKKMPQNAQVVYSCDDEGNNFQSVFYAPSKGFVVSSEFIPLKNASEEMVKKEQLVVCIN